MAIGSHLIDTIESRLYTCPNSKVSIEGTEVEIPNNAPGPIEDQIITPQIRMHYRDWGRPSLGPGQSPVLDVLALHGLGSSCHWYDILVPHLRNEFRFVAPDQRGHGQTDQPPGGYDWQTLATDVKDLMDSLRIHRAAVMGHSWGSSVALGMAAIYPDRISKLVLIDGGFFDWNLWPSASWEWFKERLRPRIVSGTPQEYLESQRRALSDCWEERLESIVMSMVRTTPEGTVKDILEPSNHAQVLEAMWNEPPTTMFPLVQCPTLIVAAGPKPDRVNSEFATMRRKMAEAAESAISDCRVEWIPETIHDIGYHKPRELALALRRFLSGA